MNLRPGAMLEAVACACTRRQVFLQRYAGAAAAASVLLRDSRERMTPDLVIERHEVLIRAIAWVYVRMIGSGNQIECIRKSNSAGERKILLLAAATHMARAVVHGNARSRPDLEAGESTRKICRAVIAGSERRGRVVRSHRWERASRSRSSIPCLPDEPHNCCDCFDSCSPARRQIRREIRWRR